MFVCYFFYVIYAQIDTETRVVDFTNGKWDKPIRGGPKAGKQRGYKATMQEDEFGMGIFEEGGVIF